VTKLWHYTCHHGRAGLGDTGTLLPPQLQPAALALLPPPLQVNARLIWLADLHAPRRAALGLTSHVLQCDRAQHRYRVVEAADAVPWREARESCPPELVELLEAAPGAKPWHWWVATQPVRVRYVPTS
jgi:hypothetical protein